MIDRWTLCRYINLRDAPRALIHIDRIYAALGNDHALQLEYHMDEDGVPADITGADVIVYGKRTDGSTVLSHGNIDGSTVRASLGEQFFAVVGTVECFVTLTKNDVTATVAQLNIIVKDAPTDKIIDPGEEFAGLQEGLDALDDLPDVTITDASVPGVVSVTMTSDRVWLVSFADGGQFQITANGDDIEVEEVTGA